MALIGGARLTNESAYAWAKLAKGVIGTDSVDAQLGDGLPAELVLGLPRATIDEACAAPVLVTLAGDLREELPVLFLRLREAVVAGATSLVEIAPHADGAEPAGGGERCASGRVTRRRWPGRSPATTAAAAALGTHHEGAAWRTGALEAAAPARWRRTPAARAWSSWRAGPSYAESGDVAAEAVRRPGRRAARATFLPALRRGNVFGALDMGLAPGILPGRVSLDAGRTRFTAAWGSVPERARAVRRREILASMAGERSDGLRVVRALVLLGADPLGDFPDRAVAEKALSAGHFVVAVTGHPSESVDAHADVVLPCAVAHERPGTTTNLEGRVSRLGPKLTAPGFAWPDWMIAAELADAARRRPRRRQRGRPGRESRDRRRPTPA